MKQLLGRLGEMLGARKSSNITRKEQKVWAALAALHGYNEFARHAKTLGERVFFRLIRDNIEQSLTKMGVEVKKVDKPTVVLTLKSKVPWIEITDADIELMYEYLVQRGYVAAKEAVGQLREALRLPSNSNDSWQSMLNTVKQRGENMQSLAKANAIRADRRVTELEVQLYGRMERLAETLGYSEPEHCYWEMLFDEVERLKKFANEHWEAGT